MKTENAIRSKWMRRVSGLLATLMLMMSFAGQASAIILFQDDATHDIDSEGIIINADDGGDEDATLQFGNDGSDATITFDDGLDKLIYSGAGMDWSSVDMFRIREDADPAGNAACGFKGELIYDTTDDELQICTVVGGAGAATWVAVNSGSDADTLDTLDSTDFLRATASDAFGDGGVYTLTIGADDTLQVDGTFDANGVVAIGDGGDTVTINGTTGDWDLTDLDFDITGNPSEITLVSDGAADDFTIELTGATDSSLVLQSTGTGTDAVDINATAGGVTVDASGAVSLDGGAASNFTTSAG
ncbi:hypothetical protein JW752_00050, partial [Candidatus Peregrinibacteria bacterium]|nr:hypothetical protein [Candidatus Peregrinibacteria bacterium]